MARDLHLGERGKGAELVGIEAIYLISGRNTRQLASS
jgi:hypothetical protein